MTDRLPAGWGFPGNARKAHAFAAGDTISACGRWMHSGHRDPLDSPPSSDDCRACRRKVENEQVQT